jgi:hypothetical protein
VSRGTLGRPVLSHPRETVDLEGDVEGEGWYRVAYVDMARSHVKQLAREALGLADVLEDCDGDLPFRHGTAAVFVTVRTDGQRFKVWSRAVSGLKPTVAVLREVNDANLSLETARVVVRGDGVFVEGVLPVESGTPAGFRALYDEVAGLADRLGSMLVAVHGGATWFSDDDVCPECGAGEES